MIENSEVCHQTVEVVSVSAVAQGGQEGVSEVSKLPPEHDWHKDAHNIYDTSEDQYENHHGEEG